MGFFSKETGEFSSILKQLGVATQRTKIMKENPSKIVCPLETDSLPFYFGHMGDSFKRVVRVKGLLSFGEANLENQLANRVEDCEL